jgi:hypothetical protein
MKYVKMLGLAAVAAAALMAFVGASTASATVLCKTPGTGTPTGTTCPANQAYPAGTEIHAVSEGNLVLTTGSEFTEITCKKGTVKGKTSNEGSATETVSGAAETITWEECSTPNGACTVTTLKPGTLEVHWIEGVDKNEKGEVTAVTGSHNGTLTSNGAEITSSCASIFGNIHCIYKAAEEDLGTVTGGNPATADFESTPVNIIATSGLCPSGPKWDAKYEITSPNPLYVAGHT